MDLEMEHAQRPAQASLLQDEQVQRPSGFGSGRLWPTGRLRLASCILLAGVGAAGLSATVLHQRGPGGRDRASEAGVPLTDPGALGGGLGAPPALPAEGSLRRNIEALVRELHADGAYRRAVLEALSGAKAKAPGVAKSFVRFQRATASTSYTRKCDYKRPGVRCDPPPCSSDEHADLGVDCLSARDPMAVCTRTCVVLTQTLGSSFLPGDADGHAIVCGDDFAALGPASPSQFFNGTVEKTTEFMAETTSFAVIDLWGAGGGGTGSVKTASSEDENFLEVSMEGDATFSGVYTRKGVTSSGASWYEHSTNGDYRSQSKYLYYDPDCSNHGFGEAWFFGSSAPDTSRRIGLDPNNRMGDSNNRCFFRAMKSAGKNSVPMGRQTWGTGGDTAVTVSIKFATTESWVCGGGGGGGAHVKALIQLQAGQMYRVELGSGGAGAGSGRAAQNGQATRLLQRTERLDWKVLAEAGGGFGAGQYNAAFQYSPGGQGGFSNPHHSHLETQPGHAGAASRGDLRGPSEILKPERLLGPKELVCDGDDSHCASVPGAGEMRCSDQHQPYGQSSTVINGMQLSSVCARVGVRQPCGDVSPPRAGCSVGSAPDWFLTCSSSFRLGSASDTSVMQCHGAAGVMEPDSPFPRSHQGPWTGKPNTFNSGPLGGSAVVGQGAAASLGAGKGGQGRCPLMRKTVAAKIRATVEGRAGDDGSTGAAVLSRCRRRGAYVLALQRCRAGWEPPAAAQVGAGAGWTLHGLWPEGAQACEGGAFDPQSLGDLRPRLEARWPSCRGGTASEEFWQWEWRKHGTCFGADQRRYFQLSLELLERHAAACAAWRTDDCRLCLTADFELCAGLSDVLTAADGA